jgi:hypothetical protein
VTIGGEKERQSIIASLAAVGATKPLGYLPLATITYHLDLGVDAVVVRFEKQGLKAKVFRADECCIKSGALYVFDPLALQKVLDTASNVLKDNSWPVFAELFVNQVAKKWIDSNHPVYTVIRRAFGEV